MTIEDYWFLVYMIKRREPDWRLGQCAFNVLWMVRPDLSEEIRADTVDPFYRDELLVPFEAWLKENW